MATAAPVAKRPAWIEQDGDTAEKVGQAWAAWKRGDKAALAEAARSLCPSAHCLPRHHAHLIAKVVGAPNVIVTNLGILLLEAGSPKDFVPMALGPGVYAKELRDGRVIVDSPRYRRAYIVYPFHGSVERVIERQASDAYASLLDVAPDLSSYVYVASDGMAHQVEDASTKEKPLGSAPTGARVAWSWVTAVPKLLGRDAPAEPSLNQASWQLDAAKSQDPAFRRFKNQPLVFFSTPNCRVVVACAQKICTAFKGRIGISPTPGPAGQHCPTVHYTDAILTVPDSTPDLLDNDAGFGFVDGEHHEVLLVGCDGKVSKRTSTEAEEEHHVTAEAEAWRTRLGPQLCSARDAVLPGAACDELEQQGQSHVP